MIPAMNDPENNERSELDPIFKQILIDLGKQLNFTPQTQVEVSRLPRTIDAVIQLDDLTEQRRLETKSCFIRLRQHNQLEFKGKADPLNLATYHTIRGRTRFYLSEHHLRFSQMSVSIICARKPVKLLKDDELKFRLVEQGYYLSGEMLPSLLIVINELPIIPKHYPMLLFASSEQTFRQTVQQVLADEQHQHYIQYAYVVRPIITQEEVMMSRSAYLTDENLTFILQDIGEELMQRLTDKELVQKSPAAQALIAEWEQRLKQSEQLIRQNKKLAEQNEQKAKKNEREAIKRKEQEKRLLQGQQRTLLRILKHRFGELPAETSQRIEATTDVDLLESWLEQALEVNHLGEMGL